MEAKRIFLLAKSGVQANKHYRILTYRLLIMICKSGVTRRQDKDGTTNVDDGGMEGWRVTLQTARER